REKLPEPARADGGALKVGPLQILREEGGRQKAERRAALPCFLLRPSSFLLRASAVAEQVRARVQLRVLPAENAGRKAEAARDLEATRAAPAQVLLCHLRRRRVAAGPYARNGGRHPLPRIPCQFAPLMRR